MGIANRARSIFMLSILLVSCAPSDDERCRSGYTYDKWNCIENDTSLPNLAPDGGLGDDVSTEGVTEPCTQGGDECEQYPDATYCIWSPFLNVGLCVIPNCKTDPDDCPDGQRCCDLPEMLGPIPNMCLPQVNFDETVKVAGSCDG